MLSNVSFNTDASGLGRLPDGEDHISALVMPFSAALKTAIGSSKKYLSIAQAEADGIIKTDPTTAEIWYHLYCFFRIAGASEIYLVEWTTLTTRSQDIYNAVEGKARQIYIPGADNYTDALSKITEVKAISDFFESQYAPAMFISSIRANVTVVDETLPDLKAGNFENVSIINVGDGGGLGNEIAASLGVSMIPMAGIVLGALSKGQVHENIGWVEKFPLAEGAEFQDVVWTDGKNVRNATELTLNELNDRGYLFARNIPGVSGTYVNDTHTTAVSTSDFAYIENVRTMQKAKRQLRTALIPDLKRPLIVNDKGQLAADTIAYFENKSSRGLNLMLNAGEISAFSVFIDENQNVLTTSKLIIQIKIVPVGVARQIVVNIGYAVSVA